ncbi:vWA domain-containing protein [Streptomyces sp. MUM 178J]|uniref:vWA domain-containing protein n=1 Tax=Streptomyces sp. MUM 178J TaxID=2791991 RepID=UPI001F04284A|nr:vWA domain-containing protein [Streptomyces sp. MUM 178J]WRQ80416.1 vWA domain-containing protein [Streptomyces sp. MUM 178J]
MTTDRLPSRPRVPGLRPLLALAVLLALAAPLAQPLPARADDKRPGGLAALLDRLVARGGANYAVAVDISDSMESSGYYARTRKVLPAFIDSLTADDRVCLVPFSEGASECELVSKAEAKAQLARLPEHATGSASNFGRAFESALDGLRRSNAEVSGVLLMSDAQLYAPDDSRFKTFESPGWAALRAKLASLSGGQEVTGYGIPLGSGEKLGDVLAKVFPRYQLLDASGEELADSLARAHDDIRIRQAVKRVRADEGKGVAVSWQATPDEPLRAGGEIRARLTATTEALPLRVGPLRLGGLPEGARASAEPSGPLELGPGERRDVVFTLDEAVEHADGLFDGTDRESWRLTVEGVVSSPLSADVERHLDGVSVNLADRPKGEPLTAVGTVVTSASAQWWAGVLGVLAVLLAAAGYLVLRRNRPMHGMLVAEAVDRPAPLRIRLYGRRTITADLSTLVEDGGTLWIKGSPGRLGGFPTLRLRCRIADRAVREAVCAPDEPLLLAGLEFRYQPGGSGPPG